ncbi:MAG TPA: putative lipid II flippase FtsW [Bacteroidota bacterium]
MKKPTSHIDIPLLLAVLTLMVFSVGLVYSASATWAMLKKDSSEYFLTRHTIRVLLGMAMIFFFMKFNYRRLSVVSKPLLVAAALLLLAVLAVGGEVKGASRWLNFGFVGFQPSEFAKFALILHLSFLLSAKKEYLHDFRHGYGPALFWIGTITVLVLLQPSFSTGAMIFALSLLLLFIGRARLRHIAMTVAALLPLLILYMFSAEYRMQRILAFLGPGDHSHRMNYQVYQGIIGFGNGGLIGVGPGESRQRDFFLPESYGDFIYSIIGEEYGFIGTIIVLGVFVLIMFRGMRIAKYAPDDFGRYLAVGITSMITLYAVVNAGVTVGVLPTTGLPMPFVSYGGSAILFMSVAVGVLLNISTYTNLRPRADSLPGVEPVQAGKVY